MNAAIRDEEVVNIILQGIVDSHRNIVRMFNQNNAGGAAPNLATVVNVLFGEAETDKACAAVVMYNKEVENATKVMSQCPAPQNPKNKFKKKGGSGKKAKQENHKCFLCKKKGYLRADCYGWKTLQEKKTKESEVSGNQDKGSTAMNAVWSGELGDIDNSPVPIRMKKDDGFYWKKASPVHSVPVMTGRSIETLEDNIVMKWHLKLAHLNEAAMKQMVKDDLVDGMSALTLED
ncbi:hypothetical protein PHMEG_00014866 [Phytophthora megakarya]|uniref:Uncharacterized protein n=1 Tax=Phytophthora megakarya TaxID=4795 RepID=A0A225W395_9STRA|nr:hypothetical protein PHMEG_00014866 [Phytophthora megakarya]